MTFLLTIDERQRFADWLEQEAATDRQLIEQLEKLGPDMAPAAERLRLEAAAALVMARKLRSAESVCIGRAQ